MNNCNGNKRYNINQNCAKKCLIPNDPYPNVGGNYIVPAPTTKPSSVVIYPSHIYSYLFYELEAIRFVCCLSAAGNLTSATVYKRRKRRKNNYVTI